MSPPRPLALILALGASPAAAEVPPALLGLWATPLEERASPGGPSAFVRQSIEFGPERERYSVEAFADPEGDVPIFTYASDGPYEVLGDWPAIPGAWALNLVNETATVTIHMDAPEIWAGLSLSACPLEVGVAVPISGCVAGPPFQVTDCVDLDVALVEGDRLRMGAPEFDRCAERPTALDAAAFERR